MYYFFSSDDDDYESFYKCISCQVCFFFYRKLKNTIKLGFLMHKRFVYVWIAIITSSSASSAASVVDVLVFGDLPNIKAVALIL